MKIPYVTTTGTIRTETITPRDKDPYDIKVEVLDLHLPGKRHPSDFTRRVDFNNPETLTPGEKYFFGGEYIGLGKYGRIELNPYDIEFIPENEVVDSITSPGSSLSSVDDGDGDSRFGT